MRKIIFGLLFFISCSGLQENKTSTEQAVNPGPKIGKYVYIDKSGCLHAGKDCLRLMFLYSEDGVSEIPNYSVKRILSADSAEINKIIYYCAYCVSDEEYEALTIVYKDSTQKSYKTNAVGGLVLDDD